MSNECIFTMTGESGTLELFGPSNAVTQFTVPAGGGSAVTVNGATVANHVAKFDNTTGELADSGVALSALQLAANIKANVFSYGGGSASFGIVVSGLTASSVAVCEFKSQANASSILTATCGTNAINIVTTADPGACVISFVAFVVAQ